MKTIQQLREEWWKQVDWTLPTWAMEQDLDTYVQDYIKEQTEPLCEKCNSVLHKRAKLKKKLLSK